MRELHHPRPRITNPVPARERSHHNALQPHRRPSGQLLFDGIVAGYIHDISPHGVTHAPAWQRGTRRLSR
jgi:hypothetical protein